MAIKKEEIINNTKRYISAAYKHNFMTPELEELLGKEFITAPASHITAYYNAFEGGLIDHILRIMGNSYKYNKLIIKEGQVENESLMKVAGLCEIGKAKLYIHNESKWHRDNLGKMYEFNPDITSMRVGERSLYYALSCGVKLNSDECAGILNHDKEYDPQSEYHNSKVGFIVTQATRMSIYEEKLLLNES